MFKTVIFKKVDGTLRKIDVDFDDFDNSTRQDIHDTCMTALADLAEHDSDTDSDYQPCDYTTNFEFADFDDAKFYKTLT